MSRRQLNLNTGLRQELQYRFLEATNRVCPEVVEKLKKVRRGLLPFDQFAEECGIPKHQQDLEHDQFGTERSGQHRNQLDYFPAQK